MARVIKISAQAKYDNTVRDTLNKVSIISGRWYNKSDSKLIDNPQKYITINYYGLFKQMPLTSEIDNIYKMCMILGAQDGTWPELPIISKGKEYKPTDNDIKNMFPLEEKQLVIINRLLFHPEDEKMFITTGVGGSGKSTFLNIVKQIFNNDFYCASMCDLSNEFVLGEAVQKRLICSDEIGTGSIDLDKMKALISKQEVNCNRKFKDPITVKAQSSLFFCCNKAPRIDLTDTGWLRRIVFYSRNTKIQNPDTSLNSKKYTERELMTIIRKAWELESKYPGDSWEDLFYIETIHYFRERNTVYSTEATNYGGYEAKCHQRGFKPMNYDNWKSTVEQLNDMEIKLAAMENRDPKLIVEDFKP